MDKRIQTKKLPKKQQQLIDTATELFSAYGFKRVTIDEICKTAGISKMTFYKYFRNKIDIAETVLDLIYSRGKAYYYEMLKEDILFSDKIEKMLLISRSQAHAIGQPLFEDMMNQNSPLNAYFNCKQEEIKQMTIDFCRNAQNEGHIRKDISIDVMMLMLNAHHDLVNQPDFADQIPDVEDRCSVLASLFFYGFAGSAQKQVF